jgi:hypothetical protein
MTALGSGCFSNDFCSPMSTDLMPLRMIACGDIHAAASADQPTLPIDISQAREGCRRESTSGARVQPRSHAGCAPARGAMKRMPRSHSKSLLRSGARKVKPSGVWSRYRKSARSQLLAWAGWGCDQCADPLRTRRRVAVEVSPADLPIVRPKTFPRGRIARRHASASMFKRSMIGGRFVRASHIPPHVAQAAPPAAVVT